MTSPTMQVHADVRVAMRDGVRLRADVYLPGRPGTAHPTLVQRVPYDKGHPAIVDGALTVRRAVDAGYAVVVQDCRGRFSSEGDFVPFVHEADDGVDTIAWIRAQAWSDGAVGMFGRSYSGLLQWLTAAEHPPGLRAIAPMLSGADLVDDWFGVDRAFELGFAAFWAWRHLAPDHLARVAPDELPELVEALADPATFFQRLGSIRDGRAARHLAYAAEWTGSRRHEAVGALRDLTADPGIVNVPAFTIAGWYDIFLRSCLRTHSLAAVEGRVEQQLLVGPWAHGSAPSGVFPDVNYGPAASADAIDVTGRQLRWFDRWLRDGRDADPDGQDVDAPVVVHDTGRGSWDDVDVWPSPAATTHRLMFTVDGRLDAQATEGRLDLVHVAGVPVPSTGGQTFLPGLEVAANAGPRDVSTLVERDDVLAFVGEAIDGEPLQLSGPVTVAIEAWTELPGTRFVVRLCVDTGTQLLILRESASSAEVGGSVSVHIDLGDVHHQVATGHRLVLLVSHTSHPRFVEGPSERLDDDRDVTSTLELGPVGCSLALSILP